MCRRLARCAPLPSYPSPSCCPSPSPYHYFLEDGPHLLIAVALLVTSDPNSDICGEEHKWLPASLRPSHDTARLFAVLNIAHTCWSIFYGCVSKTGQRVARNRPRQGPLEGQAQILPWPHPD